MNNPQDAGVDVRQAQNFLTSHFTREPSEVALIGEGAWSRCFGFRLDEEALVIRFGKHVDDFHKDQCAQMPASQAFSIGAALALAITFTTLPGSTFGRPGFPTSIFQPFGWKWRKDGVKRDMWYMTKLQDLWHPIFTSDSIILAIMPTWVTRRRCCKRCSVCE